MDTRTVTRTKTTTRILSSEIKFTCCQTSDLGLRLEVDFVFPLSQEEEQGEEQEPLTKI